ncbi:MAG: hypothetical protein A2021_01130 [Elusimicrobia bacterium GWF2_52_66]|nr:MAG: hypothetical protein A2021_01130 [Elusimicrobia bacterium GWF2_52_66]
MDAVIKIGGSIINNGRELLPLCRILTSLKNKYRFTVIAGGGVLADAIRNLQKKHGFSNTAAHFMALKAMNINSCIIKDLCPGMRLVDTAQKAQKIAAKKQIPILLAAKLIEKEKSLPKSWDLTSDSIALYAAEKLKATRTILVKNINGICVSPGGRAVKKITALKLGKLKNNTCTDKYLPKLIQKNGIPVWVVSVKYPGRIKKAFDGVSGAGTLITKE